VVYRGLQPWLCPAFFPLGGLIELYFHYTSIPNILASKKSWQPANASLFLLPGDAGQLDQKGSQMKKIKVISNKTEHNQKIFSWFLNRF